MFVVKQTATYFWPVTVEVPVSGGRFEKHTFDAEFKRVSQERMNEVFEAMELRKMTDLDFCKEILVGWKGITDGDQEIPFSEDARNSVLNMEGVAGAVSLAFMSSRVAAKRKN